MEVFEMTVGILGIVGLIGLVSLWIVKVNTWMEQLNMEVSEENNVIY